MAVLVATILVCAVVVGVTIWRPALVMSGGGRAFGLVALFVLPVLAAMMGFSRHVEQSKTTRFCLSCHTMDEYGQSLHIDDPQHLPAMHWQNGAVPRDQACFTCHTHYTMFGDLHSKLRGLRHIYVQYLGQVPARIHLYRPYNNRECLHCHAGTRPFREASAHSSEPDTMTAIVSNRLSCLARGCHPATHDVDSLPHQKLWSFNGGAR